MIEVPRDIMDVAQEQLWAAKERLKIIKTQLEEAARIEKNWDDFLRFTSRKWFMHTLDLLDKQVSTFKKLGDEDPRVLSIIEKVRLISKEASDDLIRRYPAYIEEAFRKANLPLDPESRHPRYGLKSRFFQLEIDEKKRTAKLSDNEGRLAELPADIDAIVETIQREYKRIFGRPFSGKQFLRTLRVQYSAIIKKEKQQDGVSVPIRRITSRLGKNVKGFRTDEFLADLSRLVETGPFEIGDKRLDLQQTKDTSQGMLLYGAAGRGYIGFIMFKEV